MSFCPSVRHYVACEICEFIRYVAAPGGGVSYRLRFLFCVWRTRIRGLACKQVCFQQNDALINLRNCDCLLVPFIVLAIVIVGYHLWGNRNTYIIITITIIYYYYYLLFYFYFIIFIIIKMFKPIFKLVNIKPSYYQKQEAQLSQRGRATVSVVETLKCTLWIPLKKSLKMVPFESLHGFLFAFYSNYARIAAVSTQYTNVTDITQTPHDKAALCS